MSTKMERGLVLWRKSQGRDISRRDGGWARKKKKIDVFTNNLRGKSNIEFI